MKCSVRESVDAMTQMQINLLFGFFFLSFSSPPFKSISPSASEVYSFGLGGRLGPRFLPPHWEKKTVWSSGNLLSYAFGSGYRHPYLRAKKMFVKSCARPWLRRKKTRTKLPLSVDKSSFFDVLQFAGKTWSVSCTSLLKNFSRFPPSI